MTGLPPTKTYVPVGTTDQAEEGASFRILAFWDNFIPLQGTLEPIWFISWLPPSPFDMSFVTLAHFYAVLALLNSFEKCRVSK